MKDQFFRTAQPVDNKPSDLNSEYSVKRCVQLSPSSMHQPSKRLSKNRPPESFDVDKPAIKGGGRPTRLLPHAKMLLVTIIIMFFASAG